mmetsp:Transcript_25899/g.28799  ORF Transcript_25899/g.28799 Transcript_25899/m.28799 type:complete len:716 (-) Transcript_25899:118-2265(-)
MKLCLVCTILLAVVSQCVSDFSGDFLQTFKDSVGFASHVCQVAGVECDGNDMVTNITLAAGNYKGKLPDSIAELNNSLVVLDIRDQQINWTLHTVSNFQRLTIIRAYKTLLEGEIPSSICEMSVLEELSLVENNGASGDLPDCLGKMPTLKTLVIKAVHGGILSSSFFLQSVPSNLVTFEISSSVTGNFTELFSNIRFLNLNRIALPHTQMYGDIPMLPGSLRQLELEGSHRLSGELPDDFYFNNITVLNLKNTGVKANLSKIASYFLSLTQLSLQQQIDEIPANFLNRKLETVSLPNASLTGSIPAALNNTFRNLDLSGNNLSGEIPEWVLSLPGTINLSNNNLTGTLPNVTLLSAPHRIDLSGNSLHGTLKPFLSVYTEVNLNGNQFSDDIIEIQTWIRATKINLGNNKFYGSLPNLTQTLEALDVSHNELSGCIPTGLLSDASITLLNLSNNNFTCHLTEIREPMQRLIDISHNNLYGQLPAGAVSNTVDVSDNYFWCPDSRQPHCDNDCTTTLDYNYLCNCTGFFSGSNRPMCRQLPLQIPQSVVVSTSLFIPGDVEILGNFTMEPNSILKVPVFTTITVSGCVFINGTILIDGIDGDTKGEVLKIASTTDCEITGTPSLSESGIFVNQCSLKKQTFPGVFSIKAGDCTPQDTDDGDDSSLGIIIGIVVAVVILAAIIIVVVIFCVPSLRKVVFPFTLQDHRKAQATSTAN